LRGQAADGTFAEALSAVPPFGAGLSVAVSLPADGRPEVDLGSGTTLPFQAGTTRPGELRSDGKDLIDLIPLDAIHLGTACTPGKP
jgi:hypothetical protein